jgi:hypothetical protein
MNVLLVEPNFPIPPKSKNHFSFLPIGLLKLAAYLRKKKHVVYLNRGNIESPFVPDKIFVTSLFTYWADFVKDTVTFYRFKYPSARIVVGGIYATLMPNHCKEFTGCDSVYVGQHKSADLQKPAYDLVKVDYQILHGMRGCTQKCSFCGIWKLEKLTFKNHAKIKKEIFSNKVIFYDNNILVNPYIDSILKMLNNLKINNKVVHCECQSGFDGREIAKKPYLAKLLKAARFKNIRLAWDFNYEQFPQVENWINIFENAGYRRKDLSIFMIYNWSFDFKELEQKRIKCFEWGVQISDCRFRPLNQIFDKYDSRQTQQSDKDYYIHSNWTDTQIRQFRKNVRIHNICIRHKIQMDEYSRDREKKRPIQNFELLISKIA